MSETPKPQDGSERRKQRRIIVGLQIHVSGRDSAGRRFEETSQILDVSRTGASFATARDVEMGSDLEVVIPKLGPGRSSPDDFQTLAHIVRIAKGETEGEKIIGVQFVGPRFHRVFITESTASS